MNRYLLCHFMLYLYIVIFKYYFNKRSFTVLFWKLHLLKSAFLIFQWAKRLTSSNFFNSNKLWEELKKTFQKCWSWIFQKTRQQSSFLISEQKSPTFLFEKIYFSFYFYLKIIAKSAQTKKEQTISILKRNFQKLNLSGFLILDWIKSFYKTRKRRANTFLGFLSIQIEK